MKKTFIFLGLLAMNHMLGSQTISWNGYPAGAVSTPFNSGTAPYNFTATVTKNNTTQGDGSPKYVATNPGTPCYISGSLALNANTFGNIVDAFYNVSMVFNPGFNGTCASVTFTLMDINSDESVNTFLDVVEISAIDGNSANIPIANITITPAANTTVVNASPVKRIVGHNNSSETASSPSSFFSSPCNITTVTITPPAGVPLKSINIRYRPAYGGSTSFSCSSGCAYWNLSGPARPANQYISISNLSLTPIGGGCTPLPVELISFDGNCNNGFATLNWATASELNNKSFTIESSDDAISFEEIGMVDGAGNSNQTINYSYTVPGIQRTNKYYRLKQTDMNGEFSYSGIIYISCGSELLPKMVLYPNPAENLIYFLSEEESLDWVEVRIIDLMGSQLLKQSYSLVSNTGINVNTLNEGIYLIEVYSSGSQNYLGSYKFIKD